MDPVLPKFCIFEVHSPRCVDGFRFHVIFTSLSAISGWWAGDNERLCAMGPLLRLKYPRLRQGLKPNPQNLPCVCECVCARARVCLELYKIMQISGAEIPLDYNSDEHILVTKSN